MEQTLGKRISHHRKRLGLTQDQLAEQLGVTAQAVSKWENDLSCPDIATLPRLAAIFGITTDALLGAPDREPVHQAEVVEEAEHQGIHIHKDNWELTLDSGRRWSVTFAVLVLAVGLQLLASRILDAGLTFWDILWPSSLLCYGIFGLWKRFSFLATGSLLFGGWFLLEKWDLLPFRLAGDVLLPVIIVIFGLSLLIDALKKPRRSGRHLHIHNKGNEDRRDYRADGTGFTYSASFGETTQPVELPTLSQGSISTSFGEYTLDLTPVQKLADPGRIDASCSFGELTLLIPRRFALDPITSTAFAEINFQGTPDPHPQGVLHLKVSASFGEITVKYV